MLRKWLAALTIILVFAPAAHAAQVCAWLVETGLPDHVRELDLWFESDSSVIFLYSLDGKGLISNAGESMEPGSGSYSLRPHVPVRFWSHSSTFYPPGKIDLELYLRKVPTDYYSGSLTAILASFKFSRMIPASEASPPGTLAEKQCEEIVDLQ